MYLVSGSATGDVTFWDGEDVYVLPYQDSVGKPEDDCRFVWMSSYDDADMRCLGYPKAMEAYGSDVESHCHFGYVPKILRKKEGATLGKRTAQPKVRRTLLEFCCSPTSLLCDPKFTDGHTRQVRLTEEQDMTTESGIEYALQFLRRPDAGCVTLFGALPCTWGTPWQRMQEHLRGNGPEVPTAHG